MSYEPQDTATKAHWAGVSTAGTTFVMFLVGPSMGFEPIPPESAAGAFAVLIEAGISLVVGGIVWAFTWISPKNKPKD